MTITRLTALAAIAGSALAANAQDATFELLEEVFTGTGVSDDGSRIVGSDPFSGQGYLYVNGVPQSLGVVSSVAAISGDGNVVVGEIFDDGNLEYAGRWTEDTGWVNLGDLDLGGCDANRSAAYGTNVDGSIVVGLGWEGCKGRGFMWTEEGGMVKLPQSITDSARANGVSDDGSVIGGWQQGNCRQAAAWFDGDATETLLAPADCGEVFGVSADGGTLFGQSGNGFISEAMYWTEDTGIIFLGNSPFHVDGQVPSGVLDMTADGSMLVGYSGSFFDGYLATVWTEDGPQDLKQLLVAAGATGFEGLTLEYATGISADGTTIIGRAFNPNTFATTGFVATLPGDGCYADFDGDGELTILDFVAYQNAFTAGDTSADCDGDGELTILDFVCFQNAFTTGC